jgi:riboflavin synthase alpha subunit
MFSGIIDAIGNVRECRLTPGGQTLIIHAPDYWSDVGPGSSIAIDGVCLTLTRADRADAHFDVITETLRCTTLGNLQPGHGVNLQKSLSVGDRIDGHFVQGHVDAVATITRVEKSPRESVLWFMMDARAMAYIIPKGSVAIDGISLTIAEVSGGSFSVALIPTTLERTTIGKKAIQGRVNVETDILARTVVHYLKNAANPAALSTRLTPENLSRHGFST